MTETTLIAKLNYRHQGILDWLLANPHRQLQDCAAELGYSLPWVSRVVGTDLFRAEFAKRRAGLVDVQNAQITAKLHNIANKGLEIIEKGLEGEEPIKPFDATEMALKSLGYLGGRAQQAATASPSAVNIQQNVYMVPADAMREAQEIMAKTAGRVLPHIPEKV